MYNHLFMDDFERTELTDAIHGVIGRSLIIATRFDNLCKAMARHLDFMPTAILKRILTHEEYNEMVDEIFSNHKNLNRVIQQLPVDETIKEQLHDARDARNAIVHSLTIGLERIVDANPKSYIENIFNDVENLIRPIIKGDVLISALISVMNKDELLNNCFKKSYEDKVVEWVVTT